MFRFILDHFFKIIERLLTKRFNGFFFDLLKNFPIRLCNVHNDIPSLCSQWLIGSKIFFIIILNLVAVSWKSKLLLLPHTILITRDEQRTSRPIPISFQQRSMHNAHPTSFTPPPQVQLEKQNNQVKILKVNFLPLKGDWPWLVQSQSQRDVRT